MFNLSYLLILLPTILAMIHFFRHRPEGYWFWIILFFQPFGAIIYFFAVVVFADGSQGVSHKVNAGMKERRRMKQLLIKVQAGEALPYEYFELGEIQFKLGRYQEAVSNLKESLKQAPNNDEARYYLGLAYEQLGQYQDAGMQLESLVIKDMKFKFGEAMLALARCYRGAGEEKAAIDAFRKVLKQSNFAEARYNLADLLIGQGEKEEARQVLKTLIREAAIGDIPKFQRRNERKWARKAKNLLSTL